MKLGHIALVVRNQERSRRFYESYFGFDRGMSNRLLNGVLFIRNADGFELALAEKEQTISMPPFFHFGFRLADYQSLQALKSRLSTHGVELLEEEEEQDFSSFKCRDPDGYLIEGYWSAGGL